MTIIRPILGAVPSSRLVVSRVANAGPSAVFARRLLSSTSARSMATPEPPKGSEAYQTPDYLRPPPVPRSPPLNIQLESDIDPYHGGPSALEKAANLFFFTEIVRAA